VIVLDDRRVELNGESVIARGAVDALLTNDRAGAILWTIGESDDRDG
jgi:hypothetical protein